MKIIIKRSESAKREIEAEKQHKLKLLLRASLMAFFWAGLFHFVIGWGRIVVVPISALVLVYSVSVPQSLYDCGPGKVRSILLAKALVFGFVFGMVFLSWPFIILLMAAIVIGTLISISAGQRGDDLFI